MNLKSFSLPVKLNDGPGYAHRLADKLCEAAVDVGKCHHEAGGKGGQVEDLEGVGVVEQVSKRDEGSGEGVKRKTNLSAFSLAMRSCMAYTELGTCGHSLVFYNWKSAVCYSFVIFAVHFSIK